MTGDSAQPDKVGPIRKGSRALVVRAAVRIHSRRERLAQLAAAEGYDV